MGLRHLLGLVAGRAPIDCTLGEPVPPAEPDHLMELVERHEVSLPIPRVMDERAKVRATAACIRAANQWADAAGIGITLGDLQVLEGDEYEGYRVGCRFDVIVGKGCASPAGATPRWRWSARWRDWYHLFRSMNTPDLTAARITREERQLG